METRVEELTTSLVEVYHKLDRIHFWRIINSYGPRFQMALVLGVYETLEGDAQVELLHEVQSMSAGA